jgi:hypothetical protein
LLLARHPTSPFQHSRRANDRASIHQRERIYEEVTAALVLGVKIGDVVDIGKKWIAVLSVNNRHTATVITNDGEKATIHSNYETEVAPGVWVQLGPTTSKLQLLFEAPKNLEINLRRNPEAKNRTV